MPSTKLSRFWLEITLTFLSGFFPYVYCAVTVTPFLPQSFFFDWNKQGQPVPIPVTEQCETIHITWSRGTAVGPNPTAPYYLQVYTSTYTTPLIIPVGDVLSYDWAVPFAPGTLYQICMFDRFGNTGGCQATYTVIPPSSMPNCANVTFASQLGVSALVDNGPMSQFGWVDQCTDISITPTNGTAPYTLTVAPALHPPYNISSQSNEAVNWTVSLSWASPFFISLVDSNGNMWANGPLHAGGGGIIACLAGNTTSSSGSAIRLPVAVGAGAGALIVGFLAGVLGAYVILRRRHREKIHLDRFVDIQSSSTGTPHAPMFEHGSGPVQYRPLPTVSSAGNFSHSIPTSNPSSRMDRGQGAVQYHVEPFTMPDEEGRLANDPAMVAPNYIPNIRSRDRVTSTHESVAGPSTSQAQSQLYVLHHDSQVPPVTIYHRDGTQIVELPPRYPPYSSAQSEALSEGRSASDSRSEEDRTTRNEHNESFMLHQPRQVGSVQKPARSP